LAGPTNTKRKDNKRRPYLDLAKNLFIYLGFPYLHKSKRNNNINYHHYYSPTPSGESQATEGRMYDTSESKARHARV
jgi:hypothetical protein